jgi:signal transduction histidine kinase
MLSRWRVQTSDEPVPAVIRLGVVGVLLWNLGQVGRIADLALTDTPQAIWWQAGALALALPADIVLIVAVIRNVRPRLSGWLLAAVVLPLVALLGIHPDASSPLLSSREKVQYGSVDVMDVMWAGVALAVLVWLTRTVRELDVTRRQLAARAVIIERQRIDDEVASTLGAALERIVARGELARALAESAPGRSAAELEALTARSRDTLAQARAMLSGYRDVSAEAELRAAVTLLSAAGIRARLALDTPEQLPAKLSVSARTALRETVARALEDRGLRECVLTMATADGELVIGLSRTAADRGCCEDAA